MLLGQSCACAFCAWLRHYCTKFTITSLPCWRRYVRGVSMGLFSFLFGKKDKESKEKVTISDKKTSNIDDDISVTLRTV